MMYIPWFDVDHINGDTSYLAALSVIIVNDDQHKDQREIYTANSDVVIKTRLSVHDIFDRMGAAIEGARNAEIEALTPKAEVDAFSQRDTAGSVADTLADVGPNTVIVTDDGAARGTETRPAESSLGADADWLPA